MRKFQIEEKFDDEYLYNTIIIGTAQEIEIEYKKMVDAGAITIFTDFPKFNPDKSYGMTYGDGVFDGVLDDGLKIIDANTVLSILSSDKITIL